MMMNAPDRYANIRVHCPKSIQDVQQYPCAALIMVAGAGGGNHHCSSLSAFRLISCWHFRLGYIGPGVNL